MQEESKKQDEELISSYLSGDGRSFGLLIAKYLKPIYNFVYQYVQNKDDAEDITQEIFVKVWRNIKKYDKGKNFKVWIFSMAKNATIDFLRKKKTAPFFAYENEDGENLITKNLIDPFPLPDESIDRLNLIQILNSAIDSLSPKYRLVLSMRYYDDFNFREIAESSQESFNTIKSRHRRALVKLKKILTKL